MERRRDLGDGLAGAADQVLAHRLRHLLGAGHHLQRLGHLLAELRKVPLAARAGLRAGDDDTLARQMRWERTPRWTRMRGFRPTDEMRRCRGAILAGCGLELLELQLELVEPGAALGGGADRSCRSLAISSLRCATMASSPRARASASWRDIRAPRRAARSASSSFGVGLAASVTPQVEHDAHAPYNLYPAKSAAGAASRCLSTCRQAARPRSRLLRLQASAK